MNQTLKGLISYSDSDYNFHHKMLFTFPAFRDCSRASQGFARLTSSLVCLDQARLQTCEPVSVHCRGWPVNVFQKRMQRSAVPPPEASRPCW